MNPDKPNTRPLAVLTKANATLKLANCRVGRVFEAHRKSLGFMVGLEDSTHPSLKKAMALPS